MNDTLRALLGLFVMALAAFLCWHERMTSSDTASTLWWALAIVVMEKVATASIGAITVTAQAKLAEAKAKERAP